MENREQMTMEGIEKEESKKTYLYRFEEMKDAMEMSINNLDKVREQQNKLLELVENSEQKEYFTDFLEESKKQVETFEKQRSELQVKIALLVTLLDKCKENEEVEEAINILSEILGLFKN